MLRIAAFASSVVASMPNVFPDTSPDSANRELRTQSLDECVEAGRLENPVQPLVERMTPASRQPQCAVVTSYRPAVADVKGEETGEGITEKLRRYDAYRKMLAAHFDEPEETALRKVERFEQEVKRRFVEEPGRMKLLIVVDKLLTGFDAPSATCLYVDKQMRDHGLFQAICRVNRLDGDDKEYGRVIDYKDLFRSLERSIRDYTGEAFDGYDAADVAGLLEDRLRKGRERLEEVREQVKALCEPIGAGRRQSAFGSPAPIGRADDRLERGVYSGNAKAISSGTSPPTVRAMYCRPSCR